MATTNRVKELIASTKAFPEMATREDLLQASKAIHDQLKDNLVQASKAIHDQLGGYITSLCEELANKLTNLSTNKANKKLVLEVDNKVKSFQVNYNKQLNEIDSRISSLISNSEERLQVLKLLGEKSVISSSDVEDTYIKLLSYQEDKFKEKALHLEKMQENSLVCMKTMLGELETKMLAVQADYNKKLDDLNQEYSNKHKLLEENYTKKLSEREDLHQKSLLLIKKMHEDSVEQIRSLLSNITPKIDVHVPTQESPVVNITVPEQKAPDVHVNIPEPKTKVKSIEYDTYNRPVLVTESFGDKK